MDSFTARHLVQTLQDLAHNNYKTVIMSIHQPRYDIYGLLDDIILLSNSYQIWAGSTFDMLKHFEKLNYVCPTLVNPADFILDISKLCLLSINWIFLSLRDDGLIEYELVLYLLSDKDIVSDWLSVNLLIL